MPNRFWSFLWAVLAIIVIVFGLSANDALVPQENWRYALAGITGLVTAAGLFNTKLKEAIAAPLRWLRKHPTTYWFVILIVICYTIGFWLVVYQPTNGRALKSIEFVYLFFLLWLYLYMIVYDLGKGRGRDLTAKLSKSKLTGVMITLTTLVIVFFAGEAYLRIYYITTDGYGFTAMNYHWYNNFYWSQLNSFGYRDYEPKPDPDGRLTRIAVVGDSFAVGHGIADIDQTFPQLLEKRLGDSSDVLMVANSGWDSDVEVFHLDQFPLLPNVVILSYYLNDIDYLMAGTSLDPDANFDFINDQNVHWFVLNFFLPNYIYYNLMQFTSPVRTGNFINDLIEAHLNDELWIPQANNLNAMVQWANDHDARLIVLVWPHLAAVEASRPATGRVKQFFEDAGVQVVDMTELLTGRSPSELIVNRFDTHPGTLAQQIAADALYEAVIGESEIVTSP